MGDGLLVLLISECLYERDLELEWEQVQKEAGREACGDTQVALERVLKELEGGQVAAMGKRYTEWVKEKADFAAEVKER